MTAATRLILPLLAAAALWLTPAGAHALAQHWEESGQASWYGASFAGRSTSSGAIFSPQDLTAAHESLPLGTRIRVTAQDTGRSVVVTITDRMPGKRVRIIDLSRAAAHEIGLIARGVGYVTLTEAGAAAETEEVAEAPDDLSPLPRGPRRTHHAGRTASGHHAYYHARSATRARH